MAIGVQTDCSTPALVNFGSEKLKETYLIPAIAGDMVTSLAVSEPGGGSREADHAIRQLAEVGYRGFLAWQQRNRRLRATARAKSAERSAQT